MKKMMMTLTLMLTIAATGHAMSYEEASNEALFLTDKMAYELDMTAEQYDAAYRINLEYLLGVTSYDVYGSYWDRRNRDLSYILLDWQWSAFRAASYFYRPIVWRHGSWYHHIYTRYPHRDRYLFHRPAPRLHAHHPVHHPTGHHGGSVHHGGSIHHGGSHHFGDSHHGNSGHHSGNSHGSFGGSQRGGNSHGSFGGSHRGGNIGHGTTGGGRSGSSHGGRSSSNGSRSGGGRSFGGRM